MEILLDVVRLIIGGLTLYLGAEWLVRGSAGLAHALGVKPLIIGLIVVAYGTSAPELAVSVAAILDDSPAISLGNVIGSNIANLGLILGITALIKPPAVDARLIRREIPILLASTLAAPLALLGGVINAWEAALLLFCAVLFTLYTLFVSSSSDALAGAEDDSQDPESASKLKLGGLTTVGLLFLIGGGHLFVDGAKGMAITLGISERLVGLTVVAIGTSLPELAASIVAALRGYSSLAVGTVVGSNIINIFLILGTVGLIRPIHSDIHALRLDLGFFFGITILGVLFMRGERRISRVEGVLLLIAYLVFIVLATMRG